MSANAFSLLSKKVREVIAKYGYEKPTPVQEEAIPKVLLGKNLVIIAPTGTGKTEAAVFPVIDLLVRNGIPKLGIQILYITPLRALNRDIYRRIASICSDLGIRLDIRHGDTPEAVRRVQAREPPNFLITTPETLQFLLYGARLKQALSRVRWVIIDEVHELIDSKRGVQLSLALERLEHLIAKRRVQRIGLSATVGDPEEVARFVGGEEGAEIVYVDVSKELDVKVVWPKPSQRDIEEASKIGVSPELYARLRKVKELVESSTSAIIFTNTRNTAESLTTYLKAIFNMNVEVHHGSLSRAVREDVEKRFKEGELKAIIATSSLELGIDIGHVDLVIQYMSPRQVTRLVQRVGRSGHRIGRVSRGVVVTADFEDTLEAVAIVNRALSKWLEKPDIHFKALDVLAHQLVGMAIDGGGSLKVDEAFEIVRHASPYRELTREEFDEVLEYLKSVRYIVVEGNGSIKATGAAHVYYRENVSTIPDVRKYRVVDTASRRSVGELDEEFVETYCEPGFKFILGGNVWVVDSIDEERFVVYVTEARDYVGAVPSWVGEEIPVPYEIAVDVARLRHRLARAYNVFEVMDVLGVDQETAEQVFDFVREQMRSGVGFPKVGEVLIESSGKIHVVHVPLGTKGNEALALYIGYILHEIYGVSAVTRSDAYRVLVFTAHDLDPKYIEKAMLASVDAREAVAKALKSSRLLVWRAYHVARRLGIVSREKSLREVKRVIERLLENEDSILFKEAFREVLTERIDLNTLEKFLSDLRSGKISVKVVKVSRFSPLAQAMIEAPTKLGYAPRKVTSDALAEALKARLYEETVTVVCLMCGWTFTAKVKYFSERPRCRNCGSIMLAVVSKGEVDAAVKLVKKIVRSGMRNLTSEERKLLEKLKLSAALVADYGRKAILVLAARGVGPHTARKILSEARSEDELMKKVLEAERLFLRTRPFWK